MVTVTSSLLEHDKFEQDPKFKIDMNFKELELHTVNPLINPENIIFWVEGPSYNNNNTVFETRGSGRRFSFVPKFEDDNISFDSEEECSKLNIDEIESMMSKSRVKLDDIIDKNIGFKKSPRYSQNKNSEESSENKFGRKGTLTRIIVCKEASVKYVYYRL